MAVFGCIADDFTGASDAASFLVKGGMSVQLYNGVPQENSHDTNVKKGQTDTPQALVIALKTRTKKSHDAVADSIEAAKFLLSQGVKQIYFKYCSTFDSTTEGNIGPVADALMEYLKVPFTLLCPALPVNGRIVENGRLLVNGIPLHESHMKNHPLTPMWDCRIDKLMEPQSKYACITTSVGQPTGHADQETNEKFYYLIPDYSNDADGEKIAAVYGHLPLLTGGSGLLESLAQIWTKKLSSPGEIPKNATTGQAILLAGSCSKATLDQIAWYQKQGHPCYQLDPFKVLAGDQTIEDVWAFVWKHSSEKNAILVFSSDIPEKVKESQQLGVDVVASALENIIAALAVRAVDAGYTRIVSAGGETSGAVTKALGFSSFWIGQSVAPGVPIMVPVENPDIRLILKSGNFGQEDFFGRVLDMTSNLIMKP